MNISPGKFGFHDPLDPTGTRDWIATSDPMKAARRTSTPFVGAVDEPTRGTIGQADVSYSMNYGMRGVRNLQFAPGAGRPLRTSDLAEAIATLQDQTQGERGAVALVDGPNGLTMRDVLMTNEVHAARERGHRWVPFRPEDGLHEYTSQLGQRAPRTVVATRLTDPSIRAIIDGDVVFTRA